MIQRKQTLFLLQCIICGIVMMYIPCQQITLADKTLGLCLVPSDVAEIASTLGHFGAIALNLGAVLLSFLIIFLFKKREMQIKLSYALMAFWMIIIAMVYLCPFVIKTDKIQAVAINHFVVLVGIIAIAAAWFAIKFIKKDIDLIKSADRIR